MGAGFLRTHREARTAGIIGAIGAPVRTGWLESLVGAAGGDVAGEQGEGVGQELVTLGFESLGEVRMTKAAALLGFLVGRFETDVQAVAGDVAAQLNVVGGDAPSHRQGQLEVDVSGRASDLAGWWQ